MMTRYSIIVNLVLSLLTITRTADSKLIDPYNFQLKLTELAGKAGFNKIQEIYNSRDYSNSKLDGAGLVNEVAASLSFKLNGPIKAAQKIRDAAQDEEDRFTTNPSMPECCRVHDISYQPQFRTKVDFERSCIRISSTATSGAKFPTSKVEEVMKQNFHENPSLKWQYFASEDGHYMNYPGLNTDGCSDYDPRFRPFYVETATPMPKDVVVILDRSGSMVDLHNGKKLLQIAQEAAVSVVETLNPNDRVSVVAFESYAKVLGTSDRSCLSDELAMGTPNNKKFLISKINNVYTGDATNYEAALNTAFDVLSKSSTVNSTADREQVILFLTDGKRTKGSDPVQVIADRNKHLNNRVIVFTYALGNAFQTADRDLLKEMSDQVKSDPAYGEVKKGQYNHITDPSKLRSAMASYYSRFSGTGQQTDAIFSVPYQDLLGIGLLTSVCLPVYRKSGSLFGVACSDVTLEDLLSTLTYFQAGDFSYSFIIDGTGRTLMHPLMPQPTAVTDDPLFVHIDHLERQSSASEVINGMMTGQSGSKTFISKRTFPRGSVLYEGIETTNFAATYFWSPVSKTNFSVAVVVAQNDTRATLQGTNKVPEAVHYHRLDLLSPGDKACKHFNRYSAMDYSVVMLTPRAFEDPFRYLDTTETLNDVKKYESFLKQETSDNPGLMPTILESVKTTFRAEEHWRVSDIESKVVWQYIGTKDGVMRLYPAVTLPKNYDHTKRPWYLRTVSMKGKLSVSSPYKDQWGSGNLITMSKTVVEEKSPLKPIMGVMGTDLRLTQLYQMLLSAYDICNTAEYRCFVLDSSGFVVVHEHFVQSTSGEPQIENIHVVYKERVIADDMINQGFMTRSNCLDLEHVKNQFTYRVTTLGADRLTSYAKYQIYPVDDSNVYVVIKKNIYRPVTSPCCSVINVSPDNRQCVTTRQCDCVCHTDMENFNHCLNRYTLLNDAGSTCSPQPPTLLPLPVNEEDLVRDLKVCINYRCSDRSSRETCNILAGCDWCFRKKDGSELSKQFCGTVYQCRLGIVEDDAEHICPGCGKEEGKEEENGGLIAGVIVSVIVVIVVIIIYRKRRDGNLRRESAPSFNTPNTNTDLTSSLNNPAFDSGYDVNRGQSSTTPSAATFQMTTPTAPPHHGIASPHHAVALPHHAVAPPYDSTAPSYHVAAPPHHTLSPPHYAVDDVIAPPHYDSLYPEKPSGGNV